MALVLVVDDDPTGRELLHTLLDYAGHRTVEAADGVQGLEQALQQPPDLIVADVLMPTMDGIEFVRRLREIPQFINTPVIFYSASYLESEARDLARRCDVREILTKPCEPQRIIDTISRALGTGTGSVPLPPDHELQRHQSGLASRFLPNPSDAAGQLRALIDLGLEQASEQDPQRLLASFCLAARKIIGTQYAVIGVIDPVARTIHYRYTAGMDAAVAQNMAQSVLSLTPERISARRTTIATGDAQEAGLPPSHPPVQEILVEPVSGMGQSYACLYLSNKLGTSGFTDEDQGLARVLAAQLARIYANAYLYNQVQRQMSSLETEIYERKRAQEEIQQLNAELEQRIANRTSALKEANEELEAFAQTVAHDLKSPLRAINGFARLLADQYGPSLPADGQRYLEVVCSNARSLHQLVDHLLSFSRFARQPLSARSIDMTAMTHEVCNELSEQFPEQQLALHISVLPVCTGDPDLMRQVWTNLIHNAFKFSSQREHCIIEIGGRPRVTEYLFYIRDNGSGIAPNEGPALFSAFRRPPAGENGGNGGNGGGVGLSICKRIIQRHGGTIWADGEPGVGTTIYFTLPRAIHSGA